HRARWRTYRRTPTVSGRRPWDRARPRGPTFIPYDERPREPRAGRARPRRPRRWARGRVHAIPASPRAPTPAGRHALRWRAADVRDRPRAHGATAAAVARRPQPRARAGDGQAHLRGARNDQFERPRRAPRRAERRARPGARAPRLCRRERPHRARGTARDAAAERARQAGVPGALTEILDGRKKGLRYAISARPLRRGGTLSRPDG